MGDTRTKRAASRYLLAQATAVLGWWAAMAAFPRVRAAFELDDDRPETLDAFLLGDVVVLVVGSALGGAGIRAHWRLAAPVVAATAGGSAYATLHLVGLAARAPASEWRRARLGLLPMVVATAATSLIAACETSSAR